MSKYYIKAWSYENTTHSYVGDILKFKHTFMEGPFDTLEEAVEQIRSACYDDVEIMEFEA